MTRVAGEDDAQGLGGEIGRQLTADPRALAAVALLLLALALAPGLPALPFLALAGGAALGAWHLARGGTTPGAGPSPTEPATREGADGEVPPRVALELGQDLLELARADGGAAIRADLAALRDRLQMDAGLWVPPIALRPGALPASGWAILVDDLPVASGRAPCQERLALASPADLALVGIAASPEEGGSAIAADDAPRAAALGPVLDPLRRALVGAATALSGCAHLLVGVQEAQALLDALEPAAPALVREVARQVPPPLLAEVLRRLLEEGVSVRPMRTILEAILEAGGTARGAPALTEHCRRALRRHLGRRLAPTGTLEALLVDPAAEALVREALDGETAAVHPEVVLAMAAAVSSARGGSPPVVLAAADLRRPLRNLLAPRVPDVVVLAYDELPPDLQVHPVGRVGLAA